MLLGGMVRLDGQGITQVRQAGVRGLTGPSAWLGVGAAQAGEVCTSH